MMMFEGSVILLNIKLILVILVLLNNRFVLKQTEINQMINDMQKQGVLKNLLVLGVLQ